jgi:hypothetical protein
LNSEPAESHPAIDVLTDQAAVVLQERSVVPLSSWLADAIVTATRTSRLVQLVTPATSRLTFPLAEAVRTVGGRWVVQDERRGDYYDGLRGERLAWNGSAFLPSYATPAPTLGGIDGGTLRLRVTVAHPASEELQLGRLAELCFGILTGQPPQGWGVAEPAAQPWSRAEVTAYCRRRVPEPSTLVVVGERTVGVLRVSRRPAGVVERLVLAVGSSAAGPDLDAVDRLAGELSHSRAATVATMVASLLPGRSDTTVEPRFTGWPIPYGVLVGPEPVAEFGIEHALAAPALEVLLTGPENRPLCWSRLVGPETSAGSAPSAVLTSVLRHFGVPG